MPKEIINDKRCRLVGISCMEDSEESRRIRREWDARFYDHEAFWVDAAAEESAAALAKRITQVIQQSGVGTLANEHIIAVVFLDLTKDVDQNQLRTVLEVPEVLRNALACVVDMTLEFGFLDEMAFGDRNALRANAKAVIAVNGEKTNRRKQLILVARSPLLREQDDPRWKSVMVMLDTLRRMTAPGTWLPSVAGSPNDDVGFIRYEEYDPSRQDVLNREKEKLERLLSADGYNEFQLALTQLLQKIDARIKEEFPINGNCHPIHPHMIAQASVLNKNRPKGSQREAFLKAQSSTQTAVKLTGENLKKELLNAYQPRVEKAAEELRQLLETTRVGLQLERDRSQMEVLLQTTKPRKASLEYPELQFKPNGSWGAEITEYLECARDAAAAEVKYALVEAMRAAYLAVEEGVYRDRESALKLELETIQRDLGNFRNRDKLMDMLRRAEQPRLTAFMPVLAVNTTSRYVALSRENADKDAVDHACDGGNIYSYHINRTQGGLKTIDSAEIKLFQVVLADGDDNHLEDLI